MKILGFDMNTHSTGVTAAVIDEQTNEVTSIGCATIDVSDFKVSEHTPYKNSKKKLPTSKTGSTFLNSYFKDGEEWVSKVNKTRRDAEVRRIRNDYQRDRMAQNMSHVIKKTKPDIILMERNATFNGILTIECLAKLSGTLVGICNNEQIDYEEITVDQVRRPYNVALLSMGYSRTHNVLSVKDVGKASIAWYLEDKYKRFGLKFSDFDQSDSAILVDFFVERRKHGRETFEIPIRDFINTRL